ncbi:MAG: HAD-IC family P-type ATPase, partial [Candidatus Eiseniibacteriota bacterium]
MPNEFWQSSLASLQQELRSGPTGLATAEADRRLAQSGLNILRPRRERALALQFLSKFGNPLVLLLLAAAAISAATGDVASFVIITGVIGLSVTLDFVQEYRAGQAAERLKQSVALRATILRDGKLEETTADRIVPGDVVQLRLGGLIPADGRILEAQDFMVNQALLTGEAYPIPKAPADLGDKPVGLTEASNAVFLGTSVVAGTARILVCKTGRGTALGAIADSLTTKPPATAFESGVRKFGALILRLAVLMVGFVILVNALFHRPWLESFLFATALAVGLTPELLPMIVSVTLARGAVRLAKQRVIVKRLPAVHDLGSMDVLCTDKTGTLTQAEIRLEKHVDPLGQNSDRVLKLAFLNSSMESGLKSPLDDAILKHTEVDVREWSKVQECQFDFERRRVSVLADNGTQRLLILKGAFEDVLAHSTQYEGGAAESLFTLDDPARQAISKRFEDLSREGYRVLGVAWKETPRDQTHATIDDESELVFAGMAAFEDPPKPSAAAAVRALLASGVVVKIVTGDNELVTQHVCAQLGLPQGHLLTGDEMQTLTDSALLGRVEDVSLFCRVTPPQKNRVIQALRTRGHVVGY